MSKQLIPINAFNFVTITLLFFLVTSVTKAHVTSRVSVNSTGQQANKDSDIPSISANGRFITFESRATNLDFRASNGNRHIFIHDMKTKKTLLVSVNASGQQGNGFSYVPSLSANGRYVTFESDSDNLVTGDHNGTSDIFMFDTQTQLTTLVSVNPNNTQGNNASYSPSISDDGRFIAFQSLATNLVAGDTNLSTDVFVHDNLTADTFRVSVSSNKTQGNMGSFAPSISANGRIIGFESNASNLVANDTNGKRDVFVYDKTAKTTVRVSINDTKKQGNDHSYEPSLSGGGRYIAFYSLANNLVSSDHNGGFDVFVHDRDTKLTRRVSVNTNGTQGNNWSEEPSISDDGRFVAFYSFANNLTQSDNNHDSDIFVRDRSVAKTYLTSVSSNNTQGNKYNYDPSIDADGRYVAFFSTSTNLVPQDTNNKGDIFVIDRRPTLPKNWNN